MESLARKISPAQGPGVQANLQKQLIRRSFKSISEVDVNAIRRSNLEIIRQNRENSGEELACQPAARR